jgi:hypothetical protein
LQRANGVIQALCGDAVGQQARKAFVARATLRLRVGIQLVRAAATDAVMLFRDVGQMEEMSKGTRYRYRIVERHASELVGE